MTSSFLKWGCNDLSCQFWNEDAGWKKKEEQIQTKTRSFLFHSVNETHFTRFASTKLSTKSNTKWSELIDFRCNASKLTTDDSISLSFYWNRCECRKKNINWKLRSQVYFDIDFDEVCLSQAILNVVQSIWCEATTYWPHMARNFLDADGTFV